MALRWQGRPCDPVRDTPIAHSRFGTAWGSPGGQSEGGLNLTTKLTMKFFKTWGMERRSVTKVLRALSKASSPYNLGFQSVVRSAMSSIHKLRTKQLCTYHLHVRT